MQVGQSLFALGLMSMGFVVRSLPALIALSFITTLAVPFHNVRELLVSCSAL
jgi:hypothetical protein